MNIHRLKKVLHHKDGRSTILERHTLKMEEFAPVRESIREKEILLRRAEELASVSKDQAQIGDLKTKAQALRQELAVLRTNSSEVEYLLKASPYLCPRGSGGEDLPGAQTASNGIGKFLERTGSVNKGETYTKYMEKCHSVYDYRHAGVEPTSESGRCPDCDNEMHYEQKAAELVCAECGRTIDFQDNALTGEFRDDIQILSPFAYKRMTHLKEYLCQIQAKETTDIPQDVIELMKKEIMKERITDPDEITPRRVRGYLKKLHMNKFYDHVNSIIVLITGTSALKLSSELECTFIEMFQVIQAPFEKHCPPERKNFLSYSYTLHKMCLIIGQERLCDYFPLLKSREKNYAQDCIWKKICEQLGWPFHPSV